MMTHPDIALLLARERAAELRREAFRSRLAAGAITGGRPVRAAQPPHPVLVTAARELIRLADRVGYSRDDLVRVIRGLSLS